MAVKELELKIPTSYGDITLKKWLELQGQIKNYEDEPEAVTAIMLYHLCGLEPKYLNALSVEDYNIIRTELESFIGITELPLQKIIKIGDVEYGFEPNLSTMTYGAYVDIMKYKELKIDENWPNIMSILYRPVTQKKGDSYLIKTYTGEQDRDKFLNIGMDVHFGALFFFVNLLMDLLNDTLKSTMEQDMNLNIKQILQRSGGLIPQSLSSLAEMLQSSTKLPSNL